MKERKIKAIWFPGNDKQMSWKSISSLIHRTDYFIAENMPHIMWCRVYVLEHPINNLSVSKSDTHTHKTSRQMTKYLIWITSKY